MGAVTHLRRGTPDVGVTLVAELLRALDAEQSTATPVDDGQLLTIGEAAERMRVHRQTVARLLDQGEIPTTRVGRLRRIRLIDLLGYLDKRRST